MTHLLVLTEWETLYLMVINPVFSSYNPVFYGYNYQYLMVITQYLMAISQEPCIISVYEYLMDITHWEKNTGSNPLELQLPYFSGAPISGNWVLTMGDGLLLTACFTGTLMKTSLVTIWITVKRLLRNCCEHVDFRR